MTGIGWASPPPQARPSKALKRRRDQGPGTLVTASQTPQPTVRPHCASTRSALRAHGP